MFLRASGDSETDICSAQSAYGCIQLFRNDDQEITLQEAKCSFLDEEIMTFDYGQPATLFMAKRRGGARSRLIRRRFATAAEAIRFAVEDFPALRALGALMEVGNERFDGEAIYGLYESYQFPLRRRTD